MATFSGDDRDRTQWETHPLTPDRFDDFADVVNRNRRDHHCWCLSHRLLGSQIEELGRDPGGGGEVSRARAARRLVDDGPPPGVLAYADGEPVGWCSVSPRRRIPRLVRSRLIRPLDDVDVWSVICVVVRPGHRRRGVTGHLLAGAVAWARSQGAPAVEAYPVDPGEGRVDTTMAFVGTRAMFAAAGFETVGTTDAVAGGLPRLVVRTTTGPGDTPR